jgi:hypothetical protein
LLQWPPEERPHVPIRVLTPQEAARIAAGEVIDASIMPAVPRANTHLTCVMIGELMAGRLRGR